MTDLADEKVSFFDAAILIFSPLAGLRPSRCGVALTLNFPNPGSDTSAPVYQPAMAYCAKRRAVLLVDPPAAWGLIKETAAAAA